MDPVAAIPAPQNARLEMKMEANTGIATDITACMTGDGKAWRRFVSVYAPVIHKAVHYTLQWNGGAAAGLDAQDVTQEVFCRLVSDEFHLLSTYDPARAGMATWLTVVARSTALDCLRARRTERMMRHEPYVEEELAERLWAEAPTPAGSAPDAHEELDLPPGLLSRRQSTVLRLLFQDDLDTDEVARTLDIHPKTVRSLKQNALARLRHHFCL
jgi:RNA polymerase sigma-70 factor (ECF subfamily)